jgi:U4/U6 small nuclear ribonucleoprotein PRP4
VNLVSCASDGSVRLWNLVEYVAREAAQRCCFLLTRAGSDEFLGSLVGHRERVAQCLFHPSGRFVGTARCVVLLRRPGMPAHARQSHDKSWRLWDAETCAEVLLQEGHDRPVHCLSFQNDGSLCATGGMDDTARVWDLRSGRCIQTCEGHVNNVLSVDFAPDGYHLASGSADNTVRIWDLRKRACVYTIPAHTSLVSSVRFQKADGHVLVTSSFDGTIKAWAAHTWMPLRTLGGHDGKVMTLDLTHGAEQLTCWRERCHAHECVQT